VTKSNCIKINIIENFPNLIDYFLAIPSVGEIKPSNSTVINAVTEIIVSQMLSRKAAGTIIHRAESLAIKRDKNEIALLSPEEMRSCGISSSKAKAIKLFAEHYYSDVEKFENWRNLDGSRLFYEVNKHWGLSHWTASMLAIFYFGLEDVYPVNDGSIKRVTRILEQEGITFDPEKAAPYRSYLALYLWEMLDQKLIG
jgi:DNA-3-methyladenine glycosylase II